MADVSHFELIFKPQAPASPPGVLVDRVIQGYFLEITNLETKELRYQLNFTTVEPPPAPAQPFRSLAGNTLVFADSPGVDNQAGTLVASGPAGNYRPSFGLIRVAPLATSLVALLPSAFGPTPLDPTPLALPNFEVRGFVTIRLPALLSFPPLSFKPQSPNPVKVLLTPQNRATFINAANAITGQTQASLPLASGNASNLVPPDPGGPIIVGPFELPGKLPAIEKILEANPDISRPEFLAVLLGQLDSSQANLAKFNAALAEAGVTLSVNERQGGKTGKSKAD